MLTLKCKHKQSSPEVSTESFNSDSSESFDERIIYFYKLQRDLLLIFPALSLGLLLIVMIYCITMLTSRESFP